MKPPVNLCQFQVDTIREGAASLRGCLELVRQARLEGMPEEGMELARKEQGGLLINAPTGIGKTLIAGGIAQDLSEEHKIVWMWFAPFSGVVDQTFAVLSREFPNLHPARPRVDRNPGLLQSGVVFVTTWSGVASRKTNARQTRQEREDMPSIDGLLDYARSQGFEIGVVVDEAHYAFRPNTVAFEFCREVLRPTVAIMVTATPREAEVQELTAALGVKRYHEIEISRETGVDNFLLKRGVKMALFRALPSATKTVDFKRLALREAVKEHRAIGEALEKAKINVSPLLLVQADEEKDSPQTAKRMLEEFGMPSKAIRIHTADEPDEAFLRIAEDESVEALIFKMAAATGFDAPRAFVLASLRRIRDANFGVQIIGRIMRKHRAHQLAHMGGKKPPEYLDYGYVFLADRGSQLGLLDAAKKINALRDSVKMLTGNVGIVYVGDHPEFQDVTKGASLFSAVQSAALEDVGVGSEDSSDSLDSAAGPRQLGEQEPLLTGEDFGEDSQPRPIPELPHVKQGTLEDGRKVDVWDAEFSYKLRTDLRLPKRLVYAQFDLKSLETVTRDVVDRIMLNSAQIVGLANKRTENVCRETMEIFRRLPPEIVTIRADIALKELARLSQRKFGYEIDAYGYLHERELRQLLMARLRKLAEDNGWDADDKFIREWMMKVFAYKPKSLRRAISHVAAKNIIEAEAADLPSELLVERALMSSRNIYGVYPPGMNKWETRFAEMLDADTDGIVRWWHRNPSRKPWSASVLIPGFGGYYPDFAVGVEGRADNEILLVETKRDINDQEGRAAAKTRVKHPRYGRVMMLWLDEDSGEWHLVEPNENGEDNKIVPGFHLGMMRGY